MAISLIETAPYHAVPPQPRHAITTHFPDWEALLMFVKRDPAIMQSFKSFYPRMMLHSDIKDLITRICKFAGIPENKTCLIYPTLLDAQNQVKFSTDARRGNLQLKPEDLEIRAYELDVRYYAVIFEMPNAMKVMPFWSNAGVGISSRWAEGSLEHIDKLKEVPLDSAPLPLKETPTTGVLQRRIAELLDRAPIGGERPKKVQPSDVYFFQSGMAAVYWTNDYLTRSSRAGATVLYGYAFHSTPHTLEDFSKSFKLFGHGSDQELEELEQWLEGEKQVERPVQAIWAEFPANPMMTTPDLARLRAIADKHGVLLVIDDTIGSFCNVDLMGADGADIVVTSLSKSFSGYADLLMGGVALNPLSKAYDELRTLFETYYTNDICPADLEVLEHNSRNYLERSRVLNSNALAVVNFLQGKVDDVNSPVSVVLYPTVHPQRANYEARMRSETADFTPGYGCLFSVQMEDIPTTIAFYNELGKYIHVGPHLGAHKTLVLAYVKGIYGPDLSKVTPYGLDEKAMRVSVGFEDEEETLLEIFKTAVEAAERVKHGANEHSQAPDVVTTIS